MIYISWPSASGLLEYLSQSVGNVALTSLVSMMWRPESERLVPRLQKRMVPAVVRENPQLPKH